MVTFVHVSVIITFTVNKNLLSGLSLATRDSVRALHAAISPQRVPSPWPEPASNRTYFYHVLFVSL